MQAIEIIANSLQLSPLPKPIPAPHQILIKVAAAGISRPDLMQRQGLYPAPAGASPILGLEVAGTIIEIGHAVSEFKIGDQVCALVNGGGYSEYCLASAACCLPIPNGFSFIQAAALPETFFTVWSNVFNRGGLQADETVLIHGGSSGIGTTAIQLAKAFGSTVYVTAGSEEKCQRCLALGADAAINYKQDDFVAVIKQLTAQQGVNLILDIIGGDYFPRNLKCLALEGRLIQIAIQNGNSSEINLWSVMAKRLTITGSTLRGRDDHFKGQIAQQLRQQVWPLLDNGSVKPIIDSVFPLASAELAHQRLISSQHFGKIILEI
ncbi:MAG: NAD(P)H-quinone oxidoreductase [Methylomonas sp.]